MPPEPMNQGCFLELRHQLLGEGCVMDIAQKAFGMPDAKF